MNLPRRFLRLIIAIVLAGLTACGGGGGSGGGSGDGASTPPLNYSGVSTAAPMNSGNADQFVLELFDGGSIGRVTAASATNANHSSVAPGALSTVSRLADGLLSLPRIAAEHRAAAGMVNPSAYVNQSVPCDSGTMKISGSLSDVNGTGVLTVVLTSCRLIGSLYNGRLTVNITGVDLQFVAITDARYTFDNLQVEEGTRQFRFAGYFDQHASYTSNTENLTLNIVYLDQVSGQSIKMENFSLDSQYDQLPYPQQTDQSVTGRLYDSRYGFVDIATITPLHFSSLYGFPDSGQLQFTGATQSSLLVTVSSVSDVELQLDEDGDAVYESRANKPWSELGSTTVVDSAPVANAGPDRSVDKGAVIVLDGSLSSDPDHDFISFNWHLSGKPQGSQTVLESADTMSPQLRTDITGNYVVSLVVSDGHLSSAACQVVITAHNTAPLADAGANRNASLGANVALNGLGSSDINGDPLSYQWTLEKAPPGSTASLSGNNQSIATFTPDLPGLYFFGLVVNDGEADSESASVTIRVADPSAVSQCDTDNVGSLPVSGSLLVDASQDFIPLCDGWVYLANRTFNSVDHINVATGVRDQRYQLSASPGDLELDADKGLLYATLAPASSIEKVNIVSNQKDAIPLPYPAVNLAAGNNGRLFVSMDGGEWFMRPMAVVDGPGGTVVRTYEYASYAAAYIMDYIAFDRQNDQLIGGDRDESPASLFRFSFNPTDDTLTHEETLLTGGAYGEDLAVSPDGGHFVFPNGGGNSSVVTYTMFDYSTQAMTTVFGDWNNGAYPVSAAFSPYGDKLVSVNYSKLLVFDAKTHTKLAEYPLDFSGCSYQQLAKVGYSMGGRIVYAYSKCGFDSSWGKLFWFVLDR